MLRLLSSFKFGENVTSIPVIAQSTGSDSASVIFDAMQSVKKVGRNIDVLIADTANVCRIKIT